MFSLICLWGLKIIFSSLLHILAVFKLDYSCLKLSQLEHKGNNK